MQLSVLYKKHSKYILKPFKTEISNFQIGTRYRKTYVRRLNNKFIGRFQSISQRLQI